MTWPPTSRSKGRLYGTLMAEVEWSGRLGHASLWRPLANALLTAALTEALRKELRRSTGHRVNTAELARVLRETVLRPDLID
jgi:hypothetical protein